MKLFFQLSMAAFFAVCVGCEEDTGCACNMECDVAQACVLGKCIQQKSQCRLTGGINAVSHYQLTQIGSVQEAHVFTDNNGQTSFCYWGFTDGVLDSRFGHQFAANSFYEEELKLEDRQKIKCGAIHQTENGATYVLSREEPAVVWKNNGKWVRTSLPGLQGIEAKAAMLGPNTRISMTSGDGGIVYVALSLGSDLNNQGIYVAMLKNGVVTELMNGWAEDGNHALAGHGPQILFFESVTERAFAGIVYYDPQSFRIRILDSNFSPVSFQEGIFPIIDMTKSMPVSILFVDRNRFLRTGSIDAASFEISGELFAYDDEGSTNGQLPWTMKVDSGQSMHVAAFEPWNGANALVYFVIGDTGVLHARRILSNQYASFLPGGQLSSITTDLCLRATISFVSFADEIDASSNVITRNFSVEVHEAF
ncbi:MAG: hypothetical protein JXR76_29060 [Deltaproteobacteria bacterium]|nr:hypothetical protein [Deltaproteobacteria bacterium]